MKMTKQLLVVALLALLFVPAAAFSQDQSVQGAPERGFIEFGFRGITGTVHGRTNPGDVPFSNGFRPDILNSGVNTYRDYRNSFYIPRSSMYMDSIFGTKNYFSLQTSSYGAAFDGSTLIRDQTLLATLGQRGVYKLQFRWNQTPHIFSGTTRTLYTQTSPGVWKFNGNRATLDAARVAATGAAFFNAMNSQAGNAWGDVQSNIRRNGSGLASWDINPNWNVAFLFSRESQIGTRPHGMCFGNSPSCVWAEFPENLDYLTNTLDVTTDFGQKNWQLQLGYSRQTFENNIPNALVGNPFSDNTNSTTVTANGQMSLYPNNQAQNLLLGGALHLGPLHVMTSLSPGWESQNDPFVPYTTNPFLLNRTGAAAPIPLPVSSLNGERQTLAMNYSFVVNASKSLELAARYRHYDHNNNTEEHVFNPYVGDIGAEAHLAGPSGQEVIHYAGIGGVTDPHCPGVCNEKFSFNTKDIDLSGTWFFTNKSSAKVQYARQWFDRHHRDVAQTIEDTFKAAVDLKPTTDVTLRITAAHQNREPQDSEYEWFLVPGSQRPDEGFRIRKRIDLLAQYDVTSRLSVSGFFGTTQDDFNRRNKLTSLSPLGDPSLVTITSARPTPIYGPYYVYGVLADMGWSMGADFDYLLGENVTFFGEYSRERNTNRLVSRQRSKNTASQVGCPSLTVPEDCDPINDWMTFNKDIVDSYFVGTDLMFHKNVNVSLYYNLAATKGTMLTDGVNCQIGNGPNDYCRTNFRNWRLDNATNPAVTFNFPDTVSRLHEVSAIAKFRLTSNLIPKFEYRYHRFDYKDFQTSVMNPYAYVGPVIDPGGTTGLQRMLFLGADTPGYKAHVFSATLEYHF
ncbi:MAG: MtrB/PioB family outer membrane beta-barrel protein [Acidobacteria bacterium]|nr:MtrB/PioB family outer membrane beta-barrel protein [Acidobacteriota bacterium]